MPTLSPTEQEIESSDLNVLGAMLDDAMAWHFSLRLAGTAKIAPGRIYPTLARLERAGWLESRWEHTGGTEGQRRRMYRLTGLGARVASANVKALRRTPSKKLPILGWPLPRFGEG